jgi:hypothetical protein
MNNKILIPAGLGLLLMNVEALAQTAQTVSVSNITNQCFCKATNTSVSCGKGSNPITVTFGTAVRNALGGNDYVPTNPPTVIAPGESGKAPVTTLYSPAEPGLIWIDSQSHQQGTTSLSQQGNATDYKVISIFFTYNGTSHLMAGPINANWISNDCAYSGPPPSNIQR